MNESEQWQQVSSSLHVRRDGVRAIETEDGWRIEPGGGLGPITLCPCCCLPIQTEAGARAVADLVLRVGAPIAA